MAVNAIASTNTPVHRLVMRRRIDEVPGTKKKATASDRFALTQVDIDPGSVGAGLSGLGKRVALSRVVVDCGAHETRE